MWWERRRPKPTNGWMCVCVASGERTVLVHVCLSVLVSSNPNVPSIGSTYLLPSGKADHRNDFHIPTRVETLRFESADPRCCNSLWLFF